MSGFAILIVAMHTGELFQAKVVMASLAHKIISSKTLSSPGTVKRLQAAVQRSVVISSGWDVISSPIYPLSEFKRIWQQDSLVEQGLRLERNGPTNSAALGFG